MHEKRAKSVDSFDGLMVDFNGDLLRHIFKLICAWPESDAKLSRLKKFLRGVGSAICYSLLASFVITGVFYISLEDDDIYAKITVMGPLSFTVMASIKYCSMKFRQEDFRKCIERVKVDWKNLRTDDDREIMLKSTKFARRLIVIYAVFMYGGALFYYVVAPMAAGKMIIEERNRTYWPLFCPVSKMIVDARYSPYNEIIFCSQCLTGFLIHAITVAGCSVAAVLAMHACGRMNLIQFWLGNVVNEKEISQDDASQRLVDIVKYHIRTLSFISDVENLLNKISFVEVSGNTLNLCLLGYYCIIEWNFSEPMRGVTYTIILVAVCMNIFIFCYIGELLDEQCKKVGETSYMIKWYRLPAKDSLSLILIMLMSNCSTKLTAGNFINLSLSSFADIVKSSMAYLNVLRQTTSV